jgi:hypothetical protein
LNRSTIAKSACDHVGHMACVVTRVVRFCFVDSTEAAN